MDQVINGQTALVTGGTRGIGRAIAKALAQAGATVVITGRDPVTAGEAAAQLASESSGMVEGFGCDSASASDCAGLVKDVVERHGRLDILVNNAGITNDKLILRMNDADWHGVIDTNLNGVFYLARAAARVMLRQKSGRIINITSIVGIGGNAGQANYAAAKAGIIGLTKSLAKELGSRGVTVNAVAPGYIETAMTDAIGAPVREQLAGMIPLARLGRPEDVAAAVLFLASPGAAYITGEVLKVDGGLAM